MKNKIKNILKKFNIIFLGISIIHFIITFFTDKLIFDFENINIFNYVFCKIILFILLFVFWQYIAKLIKKDKKPLSYFKIFLLYIIPLILVIIFCWPGNWFSGDVYNFYSLTIKAGYLYYLNYLTSVFYIISYMLFPCPSGAILFQIMLFGIVLSYLVKNLYDVYKSKWVFLLFIPFLMPKTIFYTIYANRPIMYGLFYLLLIGMLIIDKLKNVELTNKKLFLLSFLSGIVAYWRSESIYLVLAIPLFIFICYRVKLNFKNVVKILGCVVVAFIIVSLPQKIHEYKNKSETPSTRNMPIYISPLSYMLQFELKGDNLEKDLKNINKVLDVEEMKLYGSYIDTYCVWLGKGCMKHDFDKHDLNAFKKSYFNVVKNNFTLFMDTKFKTFMASSGVLYDIFTNKDMYTPENGQTKILDRNDTKSILDVSLRRKAFGVLEGKISFELYNKVYRLTNNFIVPIMFCCLIFFTSIFRKNLFMFLLTGMLLGHTAILFFTSPASYFMYYFNVYLCGWTLMVIVLIDIILNKKSKKYKMI